MSGVKERIDELRRRKAQSEAGGGKKELQRSIRKES
jgi:hypothetical protein